MGGDGYRELHQRNNISPPRHPYGSGFCTISDTILAPGNTWYNDSRPLPTTYIMGQQQIVRRDAMPVGGFCSGELNVSRHLNPYGSDHFAQSDEQLVANSLWDSYFEAKPLKCIIVHGPEQIMGREPDAESLVDPELRFLR